MNQSDKELLELAAKAAGYVCHWEGDVCVLDDLGSNDCSAWHPLHNNGQAFVLACDLCLTVEFGNNSVIHPLEIGGEGTDPFKATRQAIVRAAAEIGKTMP